MPRKGSEGNSSELRGNDLNLYPVSPHESGEGLPYAPEDCPSPGDKWGWKVGSRLSNTGDYRDRTVFPPSRLCENGPKRVFRSRVALKEYIRENFPGADADAVASSFSWRIPSVESKKGTFRHTKGTAEAPDSDDRVIVARCKARNGYCSTLSRLEGSSPEVMSCDICCSEPRFCRICCCIICCRPIDEACGTYDYIRCCAKIGGSTCGHISHIDCALQSFMAGTVGESSTGLNAEYYCRRCDSKTNLVAHFAELLQSCESVVVPQDRVGKILEVGIRVLQGSENGSARKLLQRIQNFKSKVSPSSSSSTASEPPNVGGKIKIESPHIMGSLDQVFACCGTKRYDLEPVVKTDVAPDEDGLMDVDPIEANTEHSSDSVGGRATKRHDPEPVVEIDVAPDEDGLMDVDPIEANTEHSPDSVGGRATKRHDPEPVVEIDVAPDEDGLIDVDPIEANTEHSSDNVGGRATKQHDPEPVVETDVAHDEDGLMDVDPVEADSEHSSDDVGDESSGQSSTPNARRLSQSENIPRLVKGDATFNAQRFHSRQEHSRYIANRHRGIIPDKGFSQTDMQSPLIRDAIESRGWEEFVKHPDENSSWELVREFYANAGFDGTSTSKVRARRVEYSADALNNFFRVCATPKGQDLLSPLKKKDTGPALKRVVLESLCKHSGPRWIDPTRPTRIRGLHMDVPNVEWWRFYRSKISPSSHLDDPNAEHLYPVYCIMKGLPLNIGEIIEADISHRATNPKVNLAHPYLILNLCRAAGVQTEEFDLDFKIGPPIKFRQISGPTTPSARMFHFDDPIVSTSESPQPSEQATPQQTEPSPCRKRRSSQPMEGEERPTSISLWDIHREMREMNSRLDTLTSRIDCNGYSIDRLQARVELFLSRAAEQLGIQFPPSSGAGPDC